MITTSGTGSSAPARGNPWNRLKQWRASAVFKQGIEAMKDMLEHFEPHTLDEAASIGGD